MKTYHTHPSAVRLIEEIIDRIPKIKSGTYNLADPTYYEKGEWRYEDLYFRYHDSTWGIELTIWHMSEGNLASIYLDRDNNGSTLIPRANWNNTWFKTLYEVRNYMPERKSITE